MEEIEESEQQRRCHIPMAEYERRSRIQRQRIDYALSEKGKKPRPPKIPLQSPPKSSHSKNVTPEPDYLDLVPVAGPRQSPEITRGPRPELVTPEQAGVGVKTPRNVPNEPLSIEGSGKLSIEGPKVSESETSPAGTRQYKQVVPYQPIWPDRGDKRELIHPLGGNTIPIKYSKEIGRNGGIERPTSTEALDSQNNALEAVKEFFHNEEKSPQKSPIEHSGAEDLAWDYGDAIPRNAEATPPQDVTPDLVNETRGRKGQVSSDPLRKFRETIGKQIKRQRGVITLPKPMRPKTYKRKTGDPRGKIYSDEGIYGNERDELWAAGDLGSSDRAELFDLYCAKCQGDHLTIFCPIHENRRQTRGRPCPKILEDEIKRIVRRECTICGRQNGKHLRTCTYKKYGGCWLCNGYHY